MANLMDVIGELIGGAEIGSDAVKLYALITQSIAAIKASPKGIDALETDALEAKAIMQVMAADGGGIDLLLAIRRDVMKATIKPA